tara:strand:+ start:1061 stop:1399 length:339 start_codon:yes stop_codon:yes gene_type:complete
MVSSKVWAVINVSLGLVAVLLVLNLMGIELPTLGMSIEQLEDEAFCVMENFQGEFIVREMSSCCAEKRELTLGCESGTWYYQDEVLQNYCLTGNRISYYLNNAAEDYCDTLW